MSKGYMYILECSDASYYTGSTIDLELRLQQHQSGEGANHTKKRLPVKLVYYEVYDRIDEAFYREKQVQGWSRKKKEALIENRPQDLPMLSRNYSQYVASTSSATDSTSSATVTPDTELVEVPAVDEKFTVTDEKFTVTEPVEVTVNLDKKILDNLKGLKYE